MCRSPGFGLTLVAETVNGTFLGAEVVSTPQGQGDPVLPEDLGRDCAKLLLEEIYRVSKTKHTCIWFPEFVWTLYRRNCFHIIPSLFSIRYTKTYPSHTTTHIFRFSK